jgi:hypothetical protein
LVRKSCNPSGATLAADVVFVSKFITDAERTPILMDQSHSLEGVKWDQGANKVTDKGLQTIKNEAYAFKARYVGTLLPKKFEPLSLFIRAQYESVPISDAYAFMLSLYPDTADGLDLMKGY